MDNNYIVIKPVCNAFKALNLTPHIQPWTKGVSDDEQANAYMNPKDVVSVYTPKFPYFHFICRLYLDTPYTEHIKLEIPVNPEFPESIKFSEYIGKNHNWHYNDKDVEIQIKNIIEKCILFIESSDYHNNEQQH